MFARGDTVATFFGEDEYHGLVLSRTYKGTGQRRGDPWLTVAYEDGKTLVIDPVATKTRLVRRPNPNPGVSCRVGDNYQAAGARPRLPATRSGRQAAVPAAILDGANLVGDSLAKKCDA